MTKETSEFVIFFNDSTGKRKVKLWNQEESRQAGILARLLSSRSKCPRVVSINEHEKRVEKP
ncbi:hypothetical protein MUO79_02705 [Candidatus Bathyarchaeota archaeon]|nr:hypothetical protein [Candidatus Bathyarchaeota archaeon]